MLLWVVLVFCVILHRRVEFAIILNHFCFTVSLWNFFLVLFCCFFSKSNLAEIARDETLSASSKRLVVIPRTLFFCCCHLLTHGLYFHLIKCVMHVLWLGWLICIVCSLLLYKTELNILLHTTSNNLKLNWLEKLRWLCIDRISRGIYFGAMGVTNQICRPADAIETGAINGLHRFLLEYSINPREMSLISQFASTWNVYIFHIFSHCCISLNKLSSVFHFHWFFSLIDFLSEKCVCVVHLNSI